MFIKEVPILFVNVLKISNELHSRSQKLLAYNLQKYHLIVAKNVFPSPRGHDVFLTLLSKVNDKADVMCVLKCCNLSLLVTVY